MENQPIIIKQVSNGFVVEPFNGALGYYTMDKVNVFNNDYDLYQFILEHFKLKPEEIKNEQ